MGNISKPNNPSKYHQGTYKLQNPEKYMGDPERIYYRSRWELRFMQYCDHDDKIKKWNAEGVTITYQDTNGNYHRYYPDFYYEKEVEGSDQYDRVLVEIKPYKETQEPKKPLKESLKSLQNYEYAYKTYKKNLLKWHAAVEWCERRGMRFVIITEHTLKKANLI